MMTFLGCCANPRLLVISNNGTNNSGLKFLITSLFGRSWTPDNLSTTLQRFAPFQHLQPSSDARLKVDAGSHRNVDPVDQRESATFGVQSNREKNRFAGQLKIHGMPVRATGKNAFRSSICDLQSSGENIAVPPGSLSGVCDVRLT